MKNIFENSFFYNRKALGAELLYLPEILGARVNSSFFGMLSSKVFLRWGLKPTMRGILCERLAKLVNKKLIYLEDGFIRSFDIGLSGESTISVIYDEVSCYFDATKETELQKNLNNINLREEEILLARNTIDKIVKNKISKYNNAPNFIGELGREGKPKILIIDQRRGDYSVKMGLADEKCFEQMLADAVKNYADYDIIIKTHPDSNSGKFEGYFNKDLIERYNNGNVFLISENCNGYSLLEKVEKVFVVTSFMGFEALMAGKEVHCYGTPFYAGRGLNRDKNPKPAHRNKNCSVEEVFYCTYIMQSRYFNPQTKRNISALEAVEYMTELKASKVKSRD